MFVEKKLNDVFKELVRQRGKQVDVAKALGISSQRLGNYLRGRAIPTDIITKWKRVYGDDLLKLCETKESTIVSRGIDSFRDEIFEGDYIGMHKRVWLQHELTMATHRELLKDLVTTVKNLTQAGSAGQ